MILWLIALIIFLYHRRNFCLLVRKLSEPVRVGIFKLIESNDLLLEKLSKTAVRVPIRKINDTKLGNTHIAYLDVVTSHIHLVRAVYILNGIH